MQAHRPTTKRFTYPYLHRAFAYRAESRRCTMKRCDAYLINIEEIVRSRYPTFPVLLK